jgi:excisionase family DNA binding protein
VPDPREAPTLGVEEAGRLLGLGRSGAYACVQRGQLPVIRLGRKLRVPTAELRRLLGLPVEG